MGRAEELQLPDYVLVYEEDENAQLYTGQRSDFLNKVEQTGLVLDPPGTCTQDSEGQKGQRAKTHIIKVNAPFEILSHAAEEMKLKMPLAVSRRDSGDHSDRGFIRRVKVLRTIDDFRRTYVSKVQNYLETDKEEDYYSAPYKHEKRHLFKGIDQEATFFHPALENLMKEQKCVYFGKVLKIKILRNASCYNAHKDMNTFLFAYNCNIICSTPNMASEVADKAVDPIRGICDNMAERRRKIEQILNRICITEAHDDCIFQVPSDDTVEVLKSSFDNAATPIFGLFICLWGTILLARWKRKNAELIYEWDVEDYENNEQVRPQFYRTKPDRIEAFCPGYRRQLKIALSISVGLVMVGCVFISVVAVVIYKTWVRFRVITSNSLENFFLSTVVSSLLNALSILVLGKGYQKIAVKMTNWENHRTETEYNDALIIKFFAFEFANNYSPLFYIAFLRTNNEQFFTSIGLPGLEDNCGELNNCMTELCFQVLMLMITHPLPKFLKDVIIPWAKHLICRVCGNTNKESHQKECSTVNDYILRDYNKPDLENFTLEEYTEKVIQYGLQMLFAVSFPLGPFIFFLTILFDIRVDAKRLLLMYKRPIAHMAQDIGHWFTVLDLINNVAVVTNGCIIAFTSEFGREKPFYQKLIILIGFEEKRKAKEVENDKARQHEFLVGQNFMTTVDQLLEKMS
ncbi:hypothetical protein chiPu_0005847 [Chiloscyllium punctatum]|uniref:Anoctamin n=1 Tax=Chiloscyllium punctatum TaxID=137246 RepID=A0A401SAL8_CHIPU|nr:hypothetical protein [Chiloscyllium punctatum]